MHRSPLSTQPLTRKPTLILDQSIRIEVPNSDSKENSRVHRPQLCGAHKQALSHDPNTIQTQTSYISPHIAIATSCTGFSSLVRTFSIFRTTSMPSTTLPKTTCLPFK